MLRWRLRIRPWEMKHGLDLVTADFVYVRWLGDRKGTEELTKTWDKIIIDRTEDLSNWVGLFRQFVTRGLKIFAYANNHYSRHGQATVRRFGNCGIRDRQQFAFRNQKRRRLFPSRKVYPAGGGWGLGFCFSSGGGGLPRGGGAGGAGGDAGLGLSGWGLLSG
jgi:hypothetical protein